MGTLYQILGVPRGADEQQVKAAFRALARRFHPDLNADVAAEQRFKEVNHAYGVLADPGARAAYDRALVRRREELRRRLRNLAATAMTTFTLTACTVSLAVWWSRHNDAAQSVQSQAPGVERTPDAQKGPKTAPRGGATVSVVPPGRRRGSGWTTYQDARFKFTLKYPADVFPFDTGPPVTMATLSSHAMVGPRSYFCRREHRRYDARKVSQVAHREALRWHSPRPYATEQIRVRDIRESRRQGVLRARHLFLRRKVNPWVANDLPVERAYLL